MVTKRLLGAGTLAFALAACSVAGTGDAQSASPDSSASTTSQGSPSPTAQKQPTTFTIASSGDILLHLSVNDFARTGATYDYTPLFAGIKPWIENADLALCSLEVPIVPPGEAPSNYPSFGSPPEIATSLKALGWDGCALATNHSRDRGFAGIESTARTLDDVGLGRAGTAYTAEDATKTQYYTVRSNDRDVVVAHLSATTLTNGYPLPEGKEWAWNVVGSLGIRSVDDLIDDARRAREAGADIVVVSMHWGTEYVTQPIDEQTDIAHQLAASGQVDLVFGNHSHVPEPVTKVDGGPGNEGMWTVWSMGNTISGQRPENHGFGVLVGLLTTATVTVPAEGPVRVTNLQWTGITQNELTDRLYTVNDVRNGADSGITAEGLAARTAFLDDAMSTSAPERTDVPVPSATLVSSERK